MNALGQLWWRIAPLAGASLAVFLTGGAISADTSEKGGITTFRSDVIVNPDATLDVREEIALDSSGHYYRHGFVRVLPVNPEDRWDPKYVGEYKRDNGIRVKVLEVTEDGKAVKHQQGQGFMYPQVQIGEEGVRLRAGEHRYLIG